MPDLESAVIPKIGSFNALPTCSADDFKSVPIAVERSRIALVARSNVAPSICVNVKRTPCIALIASSPKFVTLCNSDANAFNWSRDLLAAPPVERIAAASCACAASASDVPEINRRTARTADAVAAINEISATLASAIALLAFE